MISPRRAEEVRQWLKDRLSVSDAEVQLVEMDRDWGSEGVESGWLSYFNEHIKSQMLPGDELWLYDSGDESWENLSGEDGLALVRNGQVVALLMFSMS
jgi:hypothetical protein